MDCVPMHLMRLGSALKLDLGKVFVHQLSLIHQLNKGQDIINVLALVLIH